MANPCKVVIHAEAEAWIVDECIDARMLDWAGGWLIRNPMRPEQVDLLVKGEPPKQVHEGDVLLKDPYDGAVSWHSYLGLGGAKATLFWRKAEDAE